MRRLSASILLLLGLAGIAAFVFFGFSGKYGMNQMVSDMSAGRLDTGAIPFGVVGLACLVWSGRLFLSKKKKD